MAKKIVLTGASGHIGYHVARQLLDAGHELRLLIRKENQNTIELKAAGASIHFANLLQPLSYAALLEDAPITTLEVWS